MDAARPTGASGTSRRMTSRTTTIRTRTTTEVCPAPGPKRRARR
jgi:hypothetical protein